MEITHFWRIRSRLCSRQSSTTRLRVRTQLIFQLPDVKLIPDSLCSGEDELDLRVGQIVWVLSKDESISGDYGWWTGKIGDKVGIFPANYVTNDDGMLKNSQPDEIRYEELDVKEVIGAGKHSSDTPKGNA